MKQLITLFGLLILALGANAQEPIITAWMLNTDGKTASYWHNVAIGPGADPEYEWETTSDSADVLQVCFDADTVYVRAHGMTDSMGKFSNPGEPLPQDYRWSFPRNPEEATPSVDVGTVFGVGVLINGIPIFGLGDGASWDNAAGENGPTGDGIWNGNAWYSEGETLDSTLAAHPQQDGMYHSHATPFRLYDFPSSSHSPIVGFANDGFPVYGPYGYVDPTDASSGVKRMESGFQLRSITVRHELPDGTPLGPPEFGPDVDVTHPLGEYIEDYEWVDGLGDLDEHNGRYCVTPEYPSGTYAYFVTADESNMPVFPYYLGESYYGTPSEANTTPVVAGGYEIPSSAYCGPLSVVEEQVEVLVYPNPANDEVQLQIGSNAKVDHLVVIDQMGRILFEQNNFSGDQIIDVSEWPNGLFFVELMIEGSKSVQKLSVEH